MSVRPRFDKLAEEVKKRIVEISAAEAACERSNGAMLIDVRETEDFAKEHAAGALHLSKGVIELKIEEAAPDVATKIICYCGGGSRSALVADSLQKMGYQDVRSMAGGFKAWKETGLPTES